MNKKLDRVCKELVMPPVWDATLAFAGVSEGKYDKL